MINISKQNTKNKNVKKQLDYIYRHNIYYTYAYI